MNTSLRTVIRRSAYLKCDMPLGLLRVDIEIDYERITGGSVGTL